MKPIIIIGSGMGGATMAHALSASGLPIIVLERGEDISSSPHAHDENAIFKAGVFKPNDQWQDQNGAPFQAGNYYNIGGNSKFYGAVMARFRAEDFEMQSHLGGTAPAWPISYDDLAPFYEKAENLFEVAGDHLQDKTEPFHNAPYPRLPIPHETDIETLAKRLRIQGLNPYALPLAIDLESWLEHADHPWDAFPSTSLGKKDAQNTPLAKALSHSNVQLETGVKVTRLITDPGNEHQIIKIEAEKNGEPHHYQPSLVILSAGAVQSAALLLASSNDDFPTGLANRSDSVGRYFMNHNCTAVMALHPFNRNQSLYQKTLGINDFYLNDGNAGPALGNMQMLGKISPGILKAAAPALPSPIAHWIANRSIDWYVMSEDLPHPESRVTLADSGRVQLQWQRTNMEIHYRLVKKCKSMMKEAGYPIVLSRAFDRKTPSHQCGTVRSGHDPKEAALNPYLQSFDHSNLFVVDASHFPSSAAQNPALTIAAQALRVGDHILKTGVPST